MKKSLRYIVAAVLAITAITTQAQVQFCGYDINPGQTYTKSDFSQIKSGSFKLSSNGSYLELNNLVAEYNNWMFYFKHTNDVVLNFVGESTLTTTGNSTGTIVFSAPSSGYRNVTVTGDKVNFVNTYSSGGAAFAYIYNCHITIEDCYLKATTTNQNNDRYSVATDINEHMSTTSLVTINNSTVIGNTFCNLKDLELKHCNYATPRSYVSLETYSTGHKRLMTNGEYVKGFIILPDDQLKDGDVNFDGKVNVSDVTALVNMILGIK